MREERVRERWTGRRAIISRFFPSPTPHFASVSSLGVLVELWNRFKATDTGWWWGGVEGREGR